jgi:hypothetical protein
MEKLGGQMAHGNLNAVGGGGIFRLLLGEHITSIFRVEK